MSQPTAPRRGLVALLVVAPSAIALAGALALLIADAAGARIPSPLVGVLAVPLVALIGAAVWLSVRRADRNGARAGLQGPVLLVMYLAPALTVGLAGIAVTGGRSGAPILAAAIAVVLGAALAALTRALLPFAPRAATVGAWRGVAPAEPVIAAGVLGVQGGLAVVAAVLGLALSPIAFAGFALPVGLAAVLLLVTWRVRIDADGVRLAGPLGYPVIRIPLGDVASAGVVRVLPVADFGGYGVRIRSGVLGYITRAGEALDVVRANGAHVFITVDRPADAADALATLLTAR